MTNYDISGNLGNISSQLVKYTLDASGNLKTIVTVNNPSEKDVTATTLTRADLDYEIEQMA